MLMFIDGSDSHGGMIDRFKGILTGKILSEKYGFQFMFVYNHPFLLNDYLDINSDSGYSLANNIRINPFRSKIIRWKDRMPSWEQVDFSFKKDNFDILFYCNLDFISRFEIFNTISWGETFNHYFKPSISLSQTIKGYLPESSFQAIHLRFTSLLGDFSDSSKKNLSNEQKDELLRKCLLAVKGIIDQAIPTYFLFSDSINFIKLVKGKFPALKFTNGIPKHIDSKYLDNKFEKEFLDFYLMAHAENVFAIVGGGLYQSQFPLYASFIYNHKYNKISI